MAEFFLGHDCPRPHYFECSKARIRTKDTLQIFNISRLNWKLQCMCMYVILYSFFLYPENSEKFLFYLKNIVPLFVTHRLVKRMTDTMDNSSGSRQWAVSFIWAEPESRSCLWKKSVAGRWEVELRQSGRRHSTPRLIQRQDSWPDVLGIFG